MAWYDVYDQRYNAATSDAERQQIVSERDAEASRIASENDAWHAAHNTGPYAPAAAAAATNVPPEAFSAVQIMENVLYGATGIRGLGSWASDLYNRGASPTEIVQALRYGTDTSDAGKAAYASYLQAFPKMDVFLKEGIFSGESPEMQYISYRNTVREAAQRYGVMDNLVGNDNIASFIENRNSAAEIVNRMSQAAQAVATTPVETYAILQDYYGVSNGDLISFYLDPTTTEDILQKRYTAARIGTEAARQKFGINVSEAESLAQRGITEGQANAGFATAAERTAFMGGRGETASREDIMGSVFGDADAARKVERIAQSRIGQFQQGGAFVESNKGVTGLGTASTR